MGKTIKRLNNEEMNELKDKKKLKNFKSQMKNSCSDDETVFVTMKGKNAGDVSCRKSPTRQNKSNKNQDSEEFNDDNEDFINDIPPLKHNDNTDDDEDEEEDFEEND